MAVYYNEFDKQKAAWLRELIRAGEIAPGDVDERSIHDVRPDDLRGYTQCHFFAGVGIWSYALRLAGWEDDREVWTGSCPCPSFSAAGKGQGFDDPRHLWPYWFGLARERRPPVCFGEQVDDAIGHGWLDLVQTDLEGQAYAVGKAVLGACSVGAPHIRQRLYFCADTADARHNDAREHGSGLPLLPARLEQRGATLGGPEPLHSERWPLLLNGSDGRDRQNGRRQEAHGESGTHGEVRECGDSSSTRLPERERDRGIQCETLGAQAREAIKRGGYTRGFWADCDWWYGKDGKYRPIERGLLPLAHGAPARVVRGSDIRIPIAESTEARVLRLRGYGDGIVAQVAAEFIRAYMEIRECNS